MTCPKQIHIYNDLGQKVFDNNNNILLKYLIKNNQVTSKYTYIFDNIYLKQSIVVYLSEDFYVDKLLRAFDHI